MEKTLQLRPPKRKRRAGSESVNPFPILVESVTGLPTSKAIWQTYTGRFNGYAVEIDKPLDMSTLYAMGFFGKGSFSRGGPKQHQSPQILRKRQWVRHKQWAEQETEMKENSTGDKSLPCSEHIKKENSDSTDSIFCASTEDRRVLVIADTDTEDDNYTINLNPKLEKDNARKEVLFLMLEEAVFLNYGLGCLSVLDVTGTNFLSLRELWTLCRESESRFVERYVAYHYFRSHGWVVKSGLKYGGDFLLYKEGPGIYHASYIVLVEIYNSSLQSPSQRQVDSGQKNWLELMRLNRLAEASGKEVLLCQVFWPVLEPDQSFETPEIIKKFKVNEVIVRRWQPSIARAGIEDLN